MQPTAPPPFPAAPDQPAGISVLMATYGRERAACLAESLESLRVQTRPPEEIVLVVDGPIGADQEQVIASFDRLEGPWRFRVLRLADCGGLARALNAGLKACSMPLIFRMDSDDICLPDRLALEGAYLAAHPEIGLVSSWAEEFEDGVEGSRLKTAPTTHEAIVEALRWRNVIVHQSVAMRAEALRAAGGYRPTYGLLEDYDLWIRMVLAGVRFHIIPKVLVRARAGRAMAARRGGAAYALKEIRFRLHAWRLGFLGFGQMLVVTTLYAGFRLVSGTLRGRLYGLVRHG